MTKQEALFNYCLRLGDNSLILSQRLSAWTGHGPFLEEDLALTNIALDILGQANALLEYAGKIEGKGRTQDDLAFLRHEREFFNTLLVEQENGDYAHTITRQCIIDVFDYYFYQELSNSKDETLAGIAQKSVKEIKYHLRHSSAWMERFGDGTQDSHERVQNAINDLWRFSGELFEMNEVDEILIKEGIAVDLKMIQPKWEKTMHEILTKSLLITPEVVFMQTGGRNAIHSEYLGHILAEMQYLPRMFPGAKW
ncbi:MAG TPA: 1,2-phenylacetyl-CoA epoxidase subunit PaaC [Nitrosopumilaceae archaeon]|jgi:ring-1,2-phenylacetyl-CoA epoxidase subunit PaaC|nr:1,2-phenylacetyl-CoA epoxidase subunit PaaC [Nitrosopumilaceae archaeon]